MDYLQRLLEDGDRCPSCGDVIQVERHVEGYDEPHCLECGQQIERRRDWLDGGAGVA